jgi:4-alpha-glucanotransferase
MRRQAYAPFIAALRANMRHAGVLRIDHVMALKHLYWVPRGAAPADGAYVAYPFDDLRRILALESRRHGCAVVGEDLGTVPAGIREAMQEARVLSYRVLLFERDHHGGFAPPATYPPLAAATFSTHDIATLAGFWLGRDLEWRRALDLYPSDAARAGDVDGRRLDRRRLLERLLAEGLLDHAAAERLLPADDAPQWDPVLARAVHRLLGRATSRLALFQIEDALGEIEQANLPGTIDEHPNWRRRLGAELEDLSREAMFLDVTAALAEGRAEKAGRR